MNMNMYGIRIMRTQYATRTSTTWNRDFIYSVRMCNQNTPLPRNMQITFHLWLEAQIKLDLQRIPFCYIDVNIYNIYYG